MSSTSATRQWAASRWRCSAASSSSGAWLIAATGNPAAPALYVVVTSLITLVAILKMRETGCGRVLQR